MQRSSEAIGTLAAALARAQAELVNPEKLLTATIRSPFPREEDRTFRYASLASGLEIVRKSLGRHEIATMQTTSIDNEVGLIRLTTTLAHSSGEWMSSDWPVCPISETASPRRMGAALTYARRYALFTLVGIAGEDDLDAPDLDTAGRPPATAAETSNGALKTTETIGSARRRLPIVKPPKPILAPVQSAQLCEKLLSELAGLGSPEDAANWAHVSIASKNSLTTGDAESVEAAFRAKLNGFESEAKEQGDVTPAADVRNTGASQRVLANGSKPGHTRATEPAASRELKPSSRRGNPTPKTTRLRNKEHRRFVSLQPCLVCGRTPSDAHHLRFTQPRALGRKVSDEFIVPVCRVHHREVHRHGDEAGWWAKAGIEPLPVALTLWQATAGAPQTAEASAKAES